MKKLLVGIVIGAIFVYASLRNLAYGTIFAGLENARYEYLLVALACFVFVAMARSMRLVVMLSPLKSVRHITMFPIHCMSYMMVALVPMKMGEVVRSYIVSRKVNLPLSSVMASMVAERLLDMLCIIGIVFTVVFGSSLPAWVMRSGSLLLALFLVVLSVICVMYYRKAMSLRWVHRLVRRLPERYQADVEQIYHRFVDGLRIIARPKQLFASILLTVLVWGVTGLGIYSLFLFYNLSFPLVAAFTVLAITVLGVSLPAGPALLGNFQFSCIVALSILNLSKNDAFAFSMIYYAFGVGLSIFLGLLFSPFMGISLADIRRRMRFCNSCHSEQREG